MIGRAVRSPWPAIVVASLFAATTSPSRKRTRRGSEAAICWSWVIAQTVVPAAFSSCSSSMTTVPDAVSRAPVGSSASSRLGSPTRARAMATRCFSPPDSSFGVARSGGPGPTRASASRARSRRSRRPVPVYSRPSATLSTASRPAARWKCWNTKPMWRARSAESRASESADTSYPATRTVPVVGRSRVPMTLSIVDLPEPDGPTTARSSPAWTVRFTEHRAWTPPG
ncbi:hypothetical protein SCALM49S_00176 [Streptomyces californicus]